MGHRRMKSREEAEVFRIRRGVVGSGEAGRDAALRGLNSPVPLAADETCRSLASLNDIVGKNPAHFPAPCNWKCRIGATTRRQKESSAREVSIEILQLLIS